MTIVQGRRDRPWTDAHRVRVVGRASWESTLHSFDLSWILDRVARGSRVRMDPI